MVTRAAPVMAAVTSVRERVGAEEWEARLNLAACYRLVGGPAWESFKRRLDRIDPSDRN